MIYPPTRPLALRKSLLWLVFPLLYVAYSLIRGPRAHFYPYPFLDPDQVDGYGGVALYCVAVAMGFLVVTALVTWVGNAVRRRRDVVPVAS